MSETLARLYWAYADAQYRLRALDLAREIMDRRTTVEQAVAELYALRQSQAEAIR